MFVAYLFMAQFTGFRAKKKGYTFSMSGIDLDSWYSISTLESHTYKRAECCPYAGFFGFDFWDFRELLRWQICDIPLSKKKLC